MNNFVLEGPGGISGLQQVPSGSAAHTSKLFSFDGGANFTAGTVNFAGATVTGLSSGVDTITATNANAFAVGQNGATNPAFNVDTATASSATGLNIKSAAAAAGVALSVVSSGTNEGINIDAKGTGSVTINNVTGTGTTTIGHSLVVGAQGASIIRLTGTSSGTLVLGPNGATNPSFNIDCSTASAATGLNLKSAAAGGGFAITTISSGTDESLTVAAKGAGTVTVNPAVVATAGGAANDGVKFGSIGVGLFTGTGTPTFSAMNGSIYVDSNGNSTTTRIYVNKSGAGTAGTTWTAITTVS